MFATHSDLAAAEMMVLETGRKVSAQRRVIDELRRMRQPTRIAEKFLSRLEQALSLHCRERDAIHARMRAEAA